MNASKDFKKTFVRIARALERHLDPHDIRTALHIHLAANMAKIEIGGDLDAQGLLSAAEQKELEDAIKDRDEALAQFGFDHDPLARAIRVN